MLFLDRGRALRQVLWRLERLGYHWAYRIVDSRAFGLPQRRERVFILATTKGDPRDVLLSDDVGNGMRPRINGHAVPIRFYWTEGNKGMGIAVQRADVKGWLGSRHSFASRDLDAGRKNRDSRHSRCREAAGFPGELD